MAKPGEMGPKDQTRERLINAGLEMLNAKGYLGATTREITRAAGLTEVTMYRHFRSKDELFAEAIRQFRQSLLALVPAPSGNLRNDLLKLADGYYAHYAARSVKMMQVIPELRRHCAMAIPQVELLQVEFNQRLKDLFHYYQATGELTAEAGDHIVIVFMGPIYHYAAKDNKELQTFLQSEKYVELFLKGYGIVEDPYRFAAGG